ncbi:MAG: hypothetical protein AM325_002600 [Candidatus Thorarchaeota archaeon SMTZ1-45]|nr:MAG: hypothetical protein AM325_04400 [Candidatus Thorarchaeota archaeon SMTZ1-45]
MVDITTHGTPRVPDQTVKDEVRDDMDLTKTSESAEKVKKIVTASVLAALSIAVAPIASIVPRIPGWGIALFDPVSIFWIIAFLLGGYWVGMLSAFAGTFGLFLYDPTAIGPIFKILATLPMILVPWLGVRRLGNESRGESLSRPRFYGTLMLSAFILRLLLMVPINLIYGAIAMPFLTVEFILSYAIILNAFQSMWDALIPFIIVHKTGIFKSFGMW